METDALGKKLFGASSYPRAARCWHIDGKDALQAPNSWKTPEPEDVDDDSTETDEIEETQ